MIEAAALDLYRDGAAYVPAALTAAEAGALIAELAIEGSPGRRLRAVGSQMLEPDGKIGAAAARWLGPRARPVRAVLFDKTPQTNWSVAWHQDRTIVVRERIDAPGFGPWSLKDGLVHVAPPVSVLERMLTLRVHLDDCDETNAPLQVALGTHQLGLVLAEEAHATAVAHRQFSCLARAGDIWIYSTPVLHASSRSSAAGHRRVLQVDYSADDLPDGLEWRGIE